MSGQHAANRPIVLPGWRFATVLVALGSVGPAAVLHGEARHLFGDRPPVPRAVPDTPPSPDG